MARLAGPPPDPAVASAPGIPPDLVAIDRKALAQLPEDRWPSAASMAAALEAFLAGTAIPGIAPIGAAAAGSAGAPPRPARRRVSRPVSPRPARCRRPPGPTPTRSPTRPTLRRSRNQASPASAAPPYPDEDEKAGSNTIGWVAGIIAVLILILAGFLVFRLLSGGGKAPDRPGRRPELRRHAVHRRPESGRRRGAHGRPGQDRGRAGSDPGREGPRPGPADRRQDRPRRRSS